VIGGIQEPLGMNFANDPPPSTCVDKKRHSPLIGSTGYWMNPYLIRTVHQILGDSTLIGDMGKQAYALICMCFFRFLTAFFEIFKISFFLPGSSNGMVRSDLTPQHTVSISTKLSKMKVPLFPKLTQKTNICYIMAPSFYPIFGIFMSKLSS
jgi:hypothetical protein